MKLYMWRKNRKNDATQKKHKVKKEKKKKAQA